MTETTPSAEPGRTDATTSRTVPDRRHASADRSRQPRPRRTKSRFARLWIPNQPGAWVMVLAPAIAGTLAGGTAWRGAWVSVAWLCCYCTQFTAARWLASHGKRRYLAPMATYAAVTCAIGLPLLVLEPQLLWWAPFYAIVAGASFALAWMRKDRTLTSQIVSVIAAGGIGTVTAGMGELTRTAVLVGVTFAIFEFGQLLFVPSMAVGRRNVGNGNGTGTGVPQTVRRYYAASVALSAAMTAAGFLLHPIIGAAGVLLLARAAILPPAAWHGRIPPLTAAPCELVTSAAMIVAVALAAPVV